MATAIPDFGQLARYRRAEEVATPEWLFWDDLTYMKQLGVL